MIIVGWGWVKGMSEGIREKRREAQGRKDKRTL